MQGEYLTDAMGKIFDVQSIYPPQERYEVLAVSLITSGFRRSGNRSYLYGIPGFRVKLTRSQKPMLMTAITKLMIICYLSVYDFFRGVSTLLNLLY